MGKTTLGICLHGYGLNFYRITGEQSLEEFFALRGKILVERRTRILKTREPEQKFFRKK